MKKIPLFKTDVSWQSIANVVRVLRSGYIGEGPEVKAFEKEFETQFNVKDLITLNSGTSALELAYDLVGISEGDEVITTVFTAPATNLPLTAKFAARARESFVAVTGPSEAQPLSNAPRRTATRE